MTVMCAVHHVAANFCGCDTIAQYEQAQRKRTEDMTDTPIAASDTRIAEPVTTHADEVPPIRPTRTEIAGTALVDYVAELRNGSLNLLPAHERGRLVNLADDIEDAIARAHASIIPVPAVLEVTGNIEEKELAARYLDMKERGARQFADANPGKRSEYEHIAECFRVAASDLRAGLHLPELKIDGRIIPYNEDNDSGIRHADALRTFFTDAYDRNLKAGWWTDITTGEPKKRNVGELFVLFVTEIAEAYLAWRDKAADDKLSEYPGLGVELADLGIRWADFCGAALAGNIVEEPTGKNPGDEIFQRIVQHALHYEGIRKTPAAVGEPETAGFLPAMDIAAMTDAKLAFNAQRPDHKIENRLKEDGKRT